MSQPLGPAGPLAQRFEDGLRFLATALALAQDARHQGAAVSAACDALGCFLPVLARAAELHLPDPEGEVAHLKEQCVALLTVDQASESAMWNALDAARLARDQASRLLPLIMAARSE